MLQKNRRMQSALKNEYDRVCVCVLEFGFRARGIHHAQDVSTCDAICACAQFSRWQMTNADQTTGHAEVRISATHLEKD